MSLTERAHPLIAARVNTEVERQAEVDREQANADRIAAIEETLARLFGEGGPGRGNTTEDGAE